MRTLLLAALCATVASALPRAQVPDGAFVVSSFDEPGTTSPGGLFVVDPRVPGPPLAVQGLGPELTGNGVSRSGANCIAVRPDDNVILVGTIGMAGTTIELHEIALAGSLAVTIRTTTIGTVSMGASFGGGIKQIAMMPNGDALFCVSGLDQQLPLNGDSIGRFSASTGTVSRVSAPSSVADLNALAFDRDSSTIYVASQPFGSPATTILAVPLAGGSATVVGSTNGGGGLAVASDGSVLLGGYRGIERFDPATGTSVPVGAPPSIINGLSIEAATDNPIFVLNGIQNAGVYWMDATGSAHLLTAAITGVGSGIAALDNPRTFGTDTRGNSTFRWETTPNAGGLPRITNAQFGLQIVASGGDATGAVLFGQVRTSLTFLGFELLVQPLLSFPLAADGSVPLPLSATTPVGLSLVMQSVHLDPGAPQGIAASDGVRMTTMQ